MSGLSSYVKDAYWHSFVIEDSMIENLQMKQDLKKTLLIFFKMNLPGVYAL